MSKQQTKNALLLARKSLSTNHCAFKTTFLLDEKIKLAVTGVSQIERKKNGFH